jgi:subtilisin family serine protease
MQRRMPRQRAPIALAAVGVLLATGVGVTPALANTSTAAGLQPVVTTDVPDIPDRAADKITPAVQTRFESKESTDFWIRFADAPDLEPAKDIADWGERGQFVYDALTSTAKASQADVVADLKAAGTDYESYWISNAILVEDGTEKLAEQVAASREVKQVHERFTAERIEPVERKASAERKAPTGNAPLPTEWGLDAINAPDVWAQGDTGAGITVANIDSGVDVEHPALLQHYRGYREGESPSNDYNWFDVSGDCDGAPCDGDGHGTHVMGTMVGDDGAGNQIGVAPGANWIAANGCATCSDEDLLASGQWILAPTRVDGSDPDPAQRPHIVNAPWRQQGPGVISDFMSEEIAAWEAAGIFGTWAAGNEGAAGCGSTSSPAANVDTYAAGAFGASGDIAAFSSRGPGVHDGATGGIKPNLAAPGVDVRSSVPGGGYAELSGTSMASAHLAGAVALLWGAAPRLVGDINSTAEFLNWTSRRVEDESCGSNGGPSNNVWGRGKLDVRELLEYAPTDDYGVVAGTVTGPDGKPVAGARVAAGRHYDITDRKGAYALDLRDGAHEVSFSAYSFISATAQAAVVRDETTTVDVALEAAPTTTVSGTVTDGNGHGWPLDARVEVLGAPTGTGVWTDPFTGEYSIEVPEEATHTLMVGASVAGYESSSQEVQVGTEPATADHALPVSAGCSAPGYALTTEVGAVEEFESGEVPDGWAVEDLAGTEQVWTFDDRFELGNLTGGEGLFAEVNSWGYGEDGVQNTALTRSYDLSEVGAPGLTFDQEVSVNDDVVADVTYSIDGGESWQLSYQMPDAQGRTTAVLWNAGGQSDVRVRFHYSARGYAGVWQVDNVVLGGCTPVDGGLVAGFVKDRNTGDSLNGATVTVGKLSTKTFDPANPKVGSGYYSLFSPKVGARQIGYAAKDYKSTKATVTVVDDAVVRKGVKLAAPLLTVTPEALWRTVELGGTKSGTFTVTNEGTAPADVEVVPALSGFTPLGSATGGKALRGTTGDVTEVRTVLASGAKGARGTAANDGDGLVRNGERPGGSVTPSAPPSLLAEGTTITHSTSQDISALGGSVACEEGRTSWLRTFTLKDFEIEGKFAVTNVSFAVASVDVVNDVTVNLYELDGPFIYGNMTRLGSADVTLKPQQLTMVDVPVTGTASAGSTLVVEVVGYDAAFFIGSNPKPETAPSYFAGCGYPQPTPAAEMGYPEIHIVLNVTGDPAVDAPWLDIRPPTFTLEPGQSAKVQVGLDSSRVDEPGTYTARVIAYGSTPYDEPRARVSLKVTPPPSWGRITGTVTGVTCDDETVPLKGAFVVIDGSEYDVTLVTGPEGGYTRWMPVSNNPLTVLSSAKGYPSESKNARIIKGQTVVRNFELNKFCG